MKEIEATIKEINTYLGIEPSALLSNANLNEGERAQQMFKMILSATLQKQQENQMIEGDFNIEEFVDSQCEQYLGAGVVQFVPPVLLTRQTADRLKGLTGDPLKNEVSKIFAKFMEVITMTTGEKVWEIMKEIGMLAVSMTGMALSIAAIVGAGPIGVASLVISSVGLVSSIVSLFLTAFNCGNRDFFGLLINDSQYNVRINGNHTTPDKNGGARDGIFLKHGNLQTIFRRETSDKKEMLPFLQGLPAEVRNSKDAEGNGYIAAGLFMFAKNSGFFGAEGILRLKVEKLEHHNINLMAACGMSCDNRMMMSFYHTEHVNYKAYDYMYSAMAGKTSQNEERGGLVVKSTINDSRNSPAYGIASITQQ